MFPADLPSLLSFFFVLAVVYGALEVSSVFKNNAVKAIIALVVSFFAASSQEAVNLISAILPYAIMLFIVFFFIGFVLKFFKKGEGGKEEVDYTLLIVILALGLIFVSTENSFMKIDQNMLGVGVAVIIALLFYAAYKRH